MPNWCDNYLIFKGKKEDIKLLIKNAYLDKTNVFSLKKLIPLSETEEEAKDPEFYDYDRAIEKWGTKWDIEIKSDMVGTFSDDENLDSFFISFESAWCPPIAAIKKISKDYNLIASISYVEFGACFAGTELFANGEELSNWDLWFVRETIYEKMVPEDPDDFDDWDLLDIKFYDKLFDAQKLQRSLIE